MRKYIIAASRGRKKQTDSYIQQLEINYEGIFNTITSVAKDNLVIIYEDKNKTSNKTRLD